MSTTSASVSGSTVGGVMDSTGCDMALQQLLFDGFKTELARQRAQALREGGLLGAALYPVVEPLHDALVVAQAHQFEQGLELGAARRRGGGHGRGRALGHGVGN